MTSILLNKLNVYLFLQVFWFRLNNMKTKKYILVVSMGLLLSFAASAAQRMERCDRLVGGVAVSPDGKFTHTNREGTKAALVPISSGSNIFKIKDAGIFNSNSDNQYHVKSSNKDGKPTEVIVSKSVNAEMASYFVDYSYKLDYSSNGNCYVKSLSDISIKGRESILYDTALCKKTVDEFKQVSLTESEAKKCSSAFQKITTAMDDYRKTLS